MTLMDRDGQLANVRIEQQTTGAGVWVTDTMATQLDLHPGDLIRVVGPGSSLPGAPAPASTTIRVAGVFANLQNEPRPLPQFWCSQETGKPGYIGPPDASYPPPPLVLADRATFTALADALGVSEIQFQWQRPVAADGLTATAAGRVDQALGAILGRYPSMPFFEHEIPETVGAQPTDMAFIAARASALGSAVDHSLGPVTLAGFLVALALVASAGSYWVDRRRVEVGLLLSRGVSAAMIGAKAVLEMAPPAILGAAAGAVLSRGVVWVLGPSPLVEGKVVSASVLRVALSLLVGLVMLGAVTTLRSRRRRNWSGCRRVLVRLPWELLVIGAAGVALWRVSGSDADVAPAGASVASIGPLYLAFPLLFLLGWTLVLVRLWVAGLPRVRSAADKRGPAVFLGAARLTAEARVGAILFASASVSLGMLLFSASLTATQQNAVTAKALTFVGSQTGAYLDPAIAVPPELAGEATAVSVLPQAYVHDTAVDVIGVDPATFARGAFWTSAFGPSSPDALLSELRRASARPGTLPVIEANGELPPGARLDVPTAGDSGPQTLALRIVDRVSGFPGVNGSDVLLVTSARLLAPLDPQTELWSRTDANTLVAAVRRAGGHVSVVVSSASVLDLTQFLAVSWSFAFLQALGVLIGLIAVAGMLLYLETRQRSRLSAYAMARRMGLTRRDHLGSLVLELGVTLVGGAVVGLVLGWLAAFLVFGHLDPLPDLPPGPLLAIPLVTVLTAVVAVVVTVLLGAGWAQRSADRSSPALVMRAEQ